MGKKFRGRFEQMIEPRADEAGQAGGADDVLGVGAIASAAQIRAQDEETRRSGRGRP